MAADNLWLPAEYACDPDAIQLFCFPHAGGGSAIYHRWEKLVPPTLAILPVKLPGRESRFNEPALENVFSLISAMFPVMVDVIREPFAFLATAWADCWHMNWPNPCVKNAV